MPNQDLWLRRRLGGWDDKADNSAGVIVPLILELVQPKSVVDVGCGPGRWLHVFYEQGVKDILGMDGAWVPQDKLHVAKENFQVTDLSRSRWLSRANLIWSSAWKWRNIWRQLRRKLLWDSLASLGEVILFSAAIPDQRGISACQRTVPGLLGGKIPRPWFFECYDYIRPKTWPMPQVSFYYSCKMFCFTQKLRKGNALETKLKGRNVLPATLLSVVHPELYFRRAHPLKHIMRRLQGAFGAVTPSV